MIISLPQMCAAGTLGQAQRLAGPPVRAEDLHLALYRGADAAYGVRGAWMGWPLFIPIAFLCSSAANSGFAVARVNRRSMS